MWRRYNPNPDGKNVGDCVIRAISAAAPPEAASDVFPEIGDSDFFRLAAGKNLGAVLEVLDELLETLKITNPRAYASVMRKIQNLG